MLAAMRFVLRCGSGLVLGLIVLVSLVGCMQRRLLYYPTHDNMTGLAAQSQLARWEIAGEFTGYARIVSAPQRIWLVLHGNGGQAAQRGYVVERVRRIDSVFILEYPGYGDRSGKPSRDAFDAAARKAYNWIIQQYGIDRVVVLGESLGSGPACMLARTARPPKHLVLIVPFDVLTDVAKEKFAWLPVGLIMLDRWNNVEALQGYKGRLDVFGASNDAVIPAHHARHLAESIPGAVYHEFRGTHAWAAAGAVDLTAL